MLYQPDRHIPALKTWNPDLAEASLRTVLQDVVKAYDEAVFWPMGEGWGPGETATSIYLGAMGVLWSLDHLEHYIDTPLPFSKQELANAIHLKYFDSEAKAYAAEGDESRTVPSYLFGETGILLVQSKLVPKKSDEIWKRQFTLIEGNIENPTLEFLWGGPGTVIPLLFKLDSGAGGEWTDLFVAHAEYMRSVLNRDQFDCPIWIQDLYGEQVTLVGAGHGFVGNMYSFLRGAPYLPEELRDWARNDTLTTIIKSASIEGDCCNWSVGPSPGRSPYLLQWCHGAPGVIISLNNIPAGYSDEFDDLMVKAAETIWQAGPLKKGTGLCHGTDGNGFALLKMYRRTADPMWLDRARCFAMHAIDQSRQRFSLWEGDLGMACFIHACLAEDDRFPLLDIC